RPRGDGMEPERRREARLQDTPREAAVERARLAGTVGQGRREGLVAERAAGEDARHAEALGARMGRAREDLLVDAAVDRDARRGLAAPAVLAIDAAGAVRRGLETGAEDVRASARSGDECGQHERQATAKCASIHHGVLRLI